MLEIFLSLFPLGVMSGSLAGEPPLSVALCDLIF